ncbi:MAG TPA: DUF5665 domain-containing protein [Candidatus Saccharimonadales bacterium]|nr:DUF5665 domain-containing protein [Candidatus Saccharimonadales bacterium]
MIKKLAKKITNDNERGARHDLIEELFYDLHRSRAQVYKMNFIRGIFFGLGSVLGGTIVVGIIIWILSLLVDWPGVGNFFQQLQDTLNRSTR